MEYLFKVYNNRRNIVLKYKLEVTETGWYISHWGINGNCNPDGKELFYDNFDQDNISYPNDFGYYLEWLWEKIINTEITQQEAQKKYRN